MPTAGGNHGHLLRRSRSGYVVSTINVPVGTAQFCDVHNPCIARTLGRCLRVVPRQADGGSISGLGDIRRMAGRPDAVAPGWLVLPPGRRMRAGASCARWQVRTAVSARQFALARSLIPEQPHTTVPNEHAPGERRSGHAGVVGCRTPRAADAGDRGPGRRTAGWSGSARVSRTMWLTPRCGSP